MAGSQTKIWVHKFAYTNVTLACSRLSDSGGEQKIGASKEKKRGRGGRGKERKESL